MAPGPLRLGAHQRRGKVNDAAGGHEEAGAKAVRWRGRTPRGGEVSSSGASPSVRHAMCSSLKY